MEDLPLLEECQIISNANIEAVIMIDDFEVVGDEGYEFDNYGVGKALNLDYLAPLLSTIPNTVFFPHCPAAQETGCKRGSVVLGTNNQIIEKLQSVESLTAHTFSK